MAERKGGMERARRTHGGASGGERNGRAGVLVALAAAALALLASPALAQNGPPAEFRVKPWSGLVPACDDPEVLKTLTKRFGHREKTYWNSSLAILGFEPLPRLPDAQLALRPWGASYIPRRFCQIRGHFNDGRARRIDYSVVEDASFIGWTWGVDFCVSGLDRHRAYAPDCEAARP